MAKYFKTSNNIILVGNWVYLRPVLVNHLDALVGNLKNHRVRFRRNLRLQDLPDSLAQHHVALVQGAFDGPKVVKQVPLLPIAAGAIRVEVVILDVDDVRNREDSLLTGS